MSRFKVMMSPRYSCLIAEVKVSSRNCLLPNSKSSDHIKADSLQPFKPLNRFYKSSKCLSAKSSEVKASKKDSELKKTERDESENGKHDYEMQARRIMKSKLHWVKVHRITRASRLLFPICDGKSRVSCRAGTPRGVGWFRRLKLDRGWDLHLLHLLHLHIPPPGA